MNTPYFNRRHNAASSLTPGGDLLVTGGDSRTGYPPSVLHKNNAWEEYASIPEHRVQHCQVTVGDDIFVIGGLHGGFRVGTVYRHRNGHWTEFSSLKYARDGHVCAVLDNHVYVMGGAK